jgi:hypothetical protein
MIKMVFQEVLLDSRAAALLFELQRFIPAARDRRLCFILKDGNGFQRTHR